MLPPGEDVSQRAHWLCWGEQYFGKPWADVPFLWAESYFYLRLLQAVDFFEPGPWWGVDPFAPMKLAELADPELEHDTAWLDELTGTDLSPAEAFRAFTAASLYGNRADLGFRLAHGQGPSDRHPLLSDEVDELWQHIGSRPAGEVHLVLDNAGRELLADLLLTDHLLAAGRAGAVVLHVKPYPYYVSDAVGSDVRDCLVRLAGFAGEAGNAARRLYRAAADGRLTLFTHPFHCAPHSFHAMPDDLRAVLGSASLCVFKGDLNYRRLVRDRAWDPTLPFSAAVADLPGSIVSLRTLKSEVVVGLDRETVNRMDAAASAWRTDGSQATVQARF
jgi:hypothetical protein